MRKMPIVKVGNVVPVGDGTDIECPDWVFLAEELSGTGDSVPMDAVDGMLGGWTAFELHAIAHGLPCACPYGQAHGS